MALEPRFMFDGALALDVTHELSSVAPQRDPWERAKAPEEATPGLPLAPATAPTGAFAAAATLSKAATVARSEILFVDPGVAGHEAYIAHVRGGIRVVVLDPNRDPWQQMSQALEEGGTGWQAVHLLSHGTPGQLAFGTTSDGGGQTSQTQSSDAMARELSRWASFLDADADILLYGCSVGAGPDGQALVDRIARLTQADVAASDDPTGRSGAQGDWVLEQRTGAVDAALAFDPAWLATAEPGLLQGSVPNTPATVADGVQSVAEGSASTPLLAQTLALTDADLDRGEQTPEQIVFTLIDAPLHGFLTLDGSPIGLGSTFHLGQLHDGLLAYAHTAGGTAAQNAADGFSVKVNDGATPLADSDTAQVTLVITPVNQAPSVSGSGSVFEGQPRNATSGGVAQSAVGLFVTAEGGGDPGDDVLDLRLDSLPAHGTLHFTGQAVIGGTAQTVDRALGLQDIASGFVIAYADRGGLRYAHDGVDPSGVPPDDGFDVTVTDGGGGLGAGGAMSASARIVLDIQPVNDDPVWVEASTLNATVTAAGPNGLLDGGGDDYRVVLTPQMLSATDVDSAESSITFVLTAAPAHGHLLVDNTQLLAGATFSLADVRAGRVQYVQTAVNDAGSQPTDGFAFQVRDNTLSLRWDAQGEDFVRQGGIHVGTDFADPLRTFDFGLTLALSRTGSGGSGETDPTPVPSSQLSTDYVGRPASGATLWPLVDGQPVLLTEGATVPVTRDLLRFAAGSVPTSQIVFTIGAFNGVDAGSGAWNGSLQKDGVALRAFESFTQADVDAGRIRYVHDGGEDFASSVTLYVSAGGAGSFAEHVFHFYTTPVNDAPVASGSTGASVVEGAARVIGTTLLSFSDADDATSEPYVEDDPETVDNHRESDALDNAAWGGPGLRFRISALPSAGLLQIDPTGSGAWTAVTAADVAQQTLFDAGLVAQGRLRYVHDGGEARADSFAAVARDRWGQDSAPATVGLVITNLNDAPAIAADPTAADPTAAPGAPNLLGGPSVNDPLTTVPEGGSARIDSALLRAFDADSTAQQVQYRLTAAPTAGRLALSTNGFSFTTLGVGASFSQQQVNDGHLYYLHDGAEPASLGYPGTPDDRFTFTLSDGNREQAGNAFWIYVRPMNDRPALAVPAGPVDIDSALAARNAVTGVEVSDPDLSNGTQAGEADVVQVTVRLLDASGTVITDLAQGLGGGGAVIAHATPADTGGTWAVTRSGEREILQLQGTRAQVNAALAGLSVTFDQDLDARLQLQVIVDDRLRDSAGALVAAAGRVLANGGDFNQAASSGGVPSPVPADSFDWAGGQAVPAGHANLAVQTIELRASRVNDAAVLTGPATAGVDEDIRSLVSGTFTVADAESAAFDTPVTVTLSVASGRLDVAATGAQTRFTPTGGQAVTISGDDSASVTLSGRAADIQALLNRRDVEGLFDDANGGLFYTGASDLNHDLNGDAAGDVTLTLALDDAGSRIGGDVGAGSVARLPAPWQVGLVIAPVNDAPVVGTVGGLLTVDDDTPTAVSGFTLSDVDATDGHADGEQDVRMQVLVRLLDAQRVPLTAAAYAAAGLRLDSSVTDSGASVDAALDGQARALRLLGTREQIDAWLQGLRLTSSLPDTAGDVAFVEVVADDRTRGPQGLLTGGADGGARNQQPGLPAVPGQDTFDPYATTVSAWGVYNVTAAARAVTIVPSNDPGDIHAEDVTVAEGASTLTLDAVQGRLLITDPDAGDATGVSATVTLSAGRVVSVGGSGGSVAGLDTSAVTISGVTLAQLNARLQALTLALPDPDGPQGAATASDFNGALSVTVAYHDGGLSGGRPTQLAGDTNDPQRSPGDYAYADATGAALVTTRTFSITGTPVNDAPQRVDAQPARLAAVAEDSPEAGVDSPSGATVAALFGPRYADPLDAVPGGAPAHTLAGVAVTGNTALASQGRWQVAIGNDGWTDLPAVDDASALVLAADDRLRFVPAPDFHGTPGGLSVRLADSSGAPLTGGSRVDLSESSGLSGGTSRYADRDNAIDLVTEILPVNDRPTAQDATLAATFEDATDPPGQRVSAIDWGFDDTPDDRRATPGGGQAAGAVGGLAIVGNAADRVAQGVWQYRLDGDWVDIGGGDTAPTPATALVLPAEATLRFLPAGDFNGPPGALTVHVADAPQLLQSGADLRGTFTPTGPWSAAVALSTAVAPRNDAPVLDATVSNPLAVENDDTATGTSVPAVRLLSSPRLTDVDLTGTAGLQPGTFGAGTIRVSLDDAVAGDVLGVGGTLPEGAQLSGGTDGQPLLVTLGPDATLAQAEALLLALRYWHTGDDPDARGTDTTRTYRISVFDADNAQTGGTAGGPAGLASNELTGTVTLQARNDAPSVVLAPGTPAQDRSIVWQEPADAPHEALALAPQAVLSDPDNGALSQLTLTVTGLRDGNAEELVVAGQAIPLGTDLGDVVIGTWRASYQADTRTLSLTPDGAAAAPVADFQTLLRGIGYRSTTDRPTEGLRSVQIRVADAGPGDSGAPSDPAVAQTVTVEVDVRAANDAPVHTRPAGYIVDEDSPLALSGLAVADGDLGPGTMTLRLSVAHGTLEAAPSVPGGVPAAGVAGQGTAQLVLSGTQAQINATLAAAGAVVYRPAADRHGTDTLTMQSDDGGLSGAGGARSTTDTVEITIRPVNDAPRLTLPGPQTVEEDGLLSLTGLRVADVDADAAPITLTLAVAHGTLQVATDVPGGVGAAAVSGNGSAALPLQGSAAALQAPLAAVGLTHARAVGVAANGGVVPRGEHDRAVRYTQHLESRAGPRDAAGTV
ncbi:MAG: cadherin-like domain-containing protein, partial [Rubrivivax sp.]